MNSMMSSIDELWQRIRSEGPGGAIRVDESHPHELFVAVDPLGRRGLVLNCSKEPPNAPILDAVEVTSNQRHDMKWALGIWLRDDTLESVFSHLSTDLVESLRGAPGPAAPGLLLGRLLRWRELLEAGTGPMGMSQLRGLVGELLVLEKCLDVWEFADVVSGWVGPLSGPQDFVLPGRRIEVKAAVPSARSVHISSLDQLDSDQALLLVVVTLTTLAGGQGIAPADLVARIGDRLLSENATAAGVFRDRLDAAGYVPHPRYAKSMFRLDGFDVFEVEGDFPRLRRAQVGVGIDRVTYDIQLGACAKHHSSLRR